MGFPLRSNIFRDGTYEQKYFSQFPVQVAVLFSPTDQDFVDAFRSIFLELDKLTPHSAVRDKIFMNTVNRLQTRDFMHLIHVLLDL